MFAIRHQVYLQICTSMVFLAFVRRRSILDNMMILFEIIDYLKSKTSCCINEVALKVDMSKAYDRWD